MPDQSNTRLSLCTDEDIAVLTRIIFSLATQFVKQFPFLILEDLVQEGWRILVDPAWVDCYDSTRGTKFTTWFYGVLKRYYISFAQKEYNKTQKWDDISELELPVSGASASQLCAYNDLMMLLDRVLSPYALRLLQCVMSHKNQSSIELAKELHISERDLGYVQEELRTAAVHVLGNPNETQELLCTVV